MKLKSIIEMLFAQVTVYKQVLIKWLQLTYRMRTPKWMRGCRGREFRRGLEQRKPETFLFNNLIASICLLQNLRSFSCII